MWSTCTFIFAALVIGYIALGVFSLGAEQRTFSELLNMAVFRILSATDLPIVQLLLASVVGGFCSGRQKSAQQNATATPSPSLE